MDLNNKTSRHAGRCAWAAAVLIAVPLLASCSPPPGAGSTTNTTAVVTPVATPATSASTVPASTSAIAFDPPTGWQESPPQGGLPAGVRFERLVVGSTTAGFKTNITVVSQAAPPGVTLREAVDTTIAAVGQQGQTIIGEPEEAGTFDGSQGLAYISAMRAESSEQVVLQRQVTLLRGDRLYFVTLSGDQTDPDLRTALEAAQASWKWT